MANLEGMVHELSERAIGLVEHGDGQSWIRREADIDTVSGIWLGLVYEVQIPNEVAKILYQQKSPAMLRDVFVSTDQEVQGTLSLKATEDGAYLPAYRGSSTNYRQLFPLNKDALLDPRNLEYIEQTDDSYTDRLSRVVSWSMAKLAEDPAYVLTRAWNPFMDAGRGENPLTRRDELQEIGHIQAFDKDGQSTLSRVHLLTQSSIRGKRRYRQIALYPERPVVESVVRSGFDAAGAPITMNGLKRARAALGRFEDEFVAKSTNS